MNTIATDPPIVANGPAVPEVATPSKTETTRIGAAIFVPYPPNSTTLAFRYFHTMIKSALARAGIIEPNMAGLLGPQSMAVIADVPWPNVGVNAIKTALAETGDDDRSAFIAVYDDEADGWRVVYPEWGRNFEMFLSKENMAFMAGKLADERRFYEAALNFGKQQQPHPKL